MSEKFYLGRIFDSQTGKVTSQPLEYDPADLTTHAIITGMTGSGKTGLCIDLMEEAALQGIPAILIDPKGDLTNLLLHFPDLAPQDFQPWLDADTLRRQGKSLEQAATETAMTWRQGLADWGITQERIRALKNAADYAVYTPGSDAGQPISVLSSLEAPELPWEGNKEILRERIASTVTALLGLAGLQDVDPIRSREHILISNIFEAAWSQGKSLDMNELILQVQTPPFEKLGAFPVENFFPSKDRTTLAITLNSILASPSFQSWREGQPMNIPDLLYTKDGRPRHTVFYIAHLSESERMFFVTLLLSAYETWMRTNAGSTSLRALLYFDELMGYLPPKGDPSSKIILLRMFKQARAFGVGLVLATQNPVDIDYKALSNAGTWIIGKLQTTWDKQRLLDGLESSVASLDRASYDGIISMLGKRTFLLHNVHAQQPVIFQTRWSMNFLAGPLTRAQLPALNTLAGVSRSADSAAVTATTASASDLSRFQPVSRAEAVSFSVPEPEPIETTPAPKARAKTQPQSDLEGSQTPPAIPAGVDEYFLPVNYSITEAFKAAGEPMPVDARMEAVLYRPGLLAAAQVRVSDRRYGVDAEVTRAALVDVLARRGSLRWDDFPYCGPDLSRVEHQPSPQARYATPDASLTDSKLMTALKKDFTDWVYRGTSVTVRANEKLKVYAGPDVSAAQFRKACADAAREARDAELDKKATAIDRQIKSVQDKLSREQRELERDKVEYEQRKWEERGNLAELGASLIGLGRKKSLTTQLSKNRLTQQAKAEVDESVDAIEQFEAELEDVRRRREQMEDETNERWAAIVNEITEIPVTPKKTDIFVEYFGVAWVPYYLIRAAGDVYELPAFGAE